MLSGKGNENSDKTIIGLIIKKVTLHVQHTFFVHFFAVVLHDYNVKLPETSSLHVLWRKCRASLYSCSIFFFHCRSFSPRWPLEFLILSPPLQNFHVVFPTTTTKKCLSVALFLVKLCWPDPYFLFFYDFLFLCIPN